MKIEKKVSFPALLVSTAVFLVLFANILFFKNVLKDYPMSWENGLFFVSLVILLICANTILFSLVCFRKTTKPFLITVLLISSIAAYYMDTYNVVIDETMIDNILKTDSNEALDLLSLKLFLYLLLLGILPSILIYKIQLPETSLRKAILTNTILLAVALLLGTTIILSGSKFYTSFFREHKPLRYYANPTYFVYSTFKYIGSSFHSESGVVRTVASDASIPAADTERELVVMVVGETARADHFSLNGYTKKTNPYLEKENVISFTNVWSCGTSTAYSVPCMFSIFGRSDFSENQAKATENVLDILQRAGVNVIWLDNNSDSKGVAERIPYKDYKSPENNPVCDAECRDEGMLVNMQSYINEHPRGDIFIILHQMGSHGPAYYKRYPAQFEIFKPTCKTNQLEQCSQKEINNTYDNTLLYTDYFLSQTIKLLKSNSDNFETVMFYVSDHGESLGESSLYLHGLPYFVAPDTQKHVPMIMWFGENFDRNEIDISKMKFQKNKQLSHDNIFHTILGIMEIESTAYNKSMDIIEHGQEFN